MVAIARGLTACPTLLMIDEPFLELALGLAHRGYVLESGRNILHGPSAAPVGGGEAHLPRCLGRRARCPVWSPSGAACYDDCQ